MACQTCRRLKVRCSGERPCARCHRLNQTCTYNPSNRADSRRASAALPRNSETPTPPVFTERTVVLDASKARTRQEEGTAHDRVPAARETPGIAVSTWTRPYSSSPHDRVEKHRLASTASGHAENEQSSSTLRPTSAFSPFTYNDRVPGQKIYDEQVPACAQPLCDMVDPILSGVISEDAARLLFIMFQAGPGQHFPLAGHTFEETRLTSPFLFAVMLCIAYTNVPHGMNQAEGIEEPVDRIASALSHLALRYLSRSLLKRPDSREDTVAAFLMALWNTRRDLVDSPSSYMILGHALRMSKRQGFHDSSAMSPEWALYTELETYDHLYILGYGRPLDGVSEAQRPTDTETSSSTLYAGVVARSELVPIIREIITRNRPSRISTSLTLASTMDELNEQLDEWYFRWTSPASDLYHALGTDRVFTLLLAAHIRLTLNMVGLDQQVATPRRSKTRRLALSAATTIIDCFAEPGPLAGPEGLISVKTAPAISVSILAHAASCLIPGRIDGEVSATRRSSGSAPTDKILRTPSSVTENYLSKALDLLKLNKLNQSFSTTRFARTIELQWKRKQSRMSADHSATPTPMAAIPNQLISTEHINSNLEMNDVENFTQVDYAPFDFTKYISSWDEMDM